MCVHTWNCHRAFPRMCPELQPQAWQNWTEVIPVSRGFRHIHVGACLAKHAQGHNEMCDNHNIQDMYVRNHVSMCVLLSGRGSSQQGCWRPRFAKLVDTKFRTYNFYQKTKQNILMPPVLLWSCLWQLGYIWYSTSNQHRWMWGGVRRPVVG